MLQKLEKIERQAKANKNELIELAKDETMRELVIKSINKWLNSDNLKLQIVATSFIDELGKISPNECVPFKDKLIELIKTTNKRLLWGTLTAIESFSVEIKGFLFNHINLIISASERGSIVAKDHAVKIYSTLCNEKIYYQTCSELIKEQIRACSDNQLGQYTERYLEVVQISDLQELLEILRLRVAGLQNPHHTRRTQDNINKVKKLIKF